MRVSPRRARVYVCGPLGWSDLSGWNPLVVTTSNTSRADQNHVKGFDLDMAGKLKNLQRFGTFAGASYVDYVLCFGDLQWVPALNQAERNVPLCPTMSHLPPPGAAGPLGTPSDGVGDRGRPQQRKPWRSCWGTSQERTEAMDRRAGVAGRSELALEAKVSRQLGLQRRCFF